MKAPRTVQLRISNDDPPANWTVIMASEPKRQAVDVVEMTAR